MGNQHYTLLPWNLQILLSIAKCPNNDSMKRIPFTIKSLCTQPPSYWKHFLNLFLDFMTLTFLILQDDYFEELQTIRVSLIFSYYYVKVLHLQQEERGDDVLFLLHPLKQCAILFCSIKDDVHLLSLKQGDVGYSTTLWSFLFCIVIRRQLLEWYFRVVSKYSVFSSSFNLHS